MPTIHQTFIDPHILLLEIDNPPANSLSKIIKTQFVAILNEIEQNQELRCLIIAGRGKHFCTGDDLKDAAIATGAFPFAFKSKILAIEREKLAAQLKNRLGIKEDQIDLEKPIFRFRAVDGGTINNEPISEVEAFFS